MTPTVSIVILTNNSMGVIQRLMDRLLEDLEPFSPRQVLVFVNGAGGTSLMELHIIYRRIFQGLRSRGVEVAAGVVDSFFTTQEMGGFSLSLCVPDQEMLTNWNHPATSPAFRWPYI